MKNPCLFYPKVGRDRTLVRNFTYRVWPILSYKALCVIRHGLLSPLQYENVVCMLFNLFLGYYLKLTLGTAFVHIYI